jgi:glycerophosphoryl diester phosphodiesterase
MFECVFVRGRGLRLILILVLAACGAAPDASMGNTGAGGGGGAGGGPSTVLDPGLFDCSAGAPPERTTNIPVTCLLDSTCAERFVVGHRAAGGELGVVAPENSLAAVRAAIAMGVDAIETDPRTTKDGVLVNLHDATVDRTTDGVGEVADLTFAELSALTLDAARYPGDFSCERVPSIEDVLLAARGKAHVLLDANKTDRIDLLVAAIQKTGTLDWAIVDTDEVAKIDAALALEPKVLTMIRVKSMAELDAELAHFEANPPAIVELDSAPGYEAIAAKARAAGHRTMVNVFGLDLAAKLSSDPSVYAPVFEAPIDLVQTDRPDLVLRHLGRFADPR